MDRGGAWGAEAPPSKDSMTSAGLCCNTIIAIIHLLHYFLSFRSLLPVKIPIFKCTCCLWAGMYVDDVTYNVFTVQREWHNALVQYDLAGWLVVST